MNRLVLRRPLALLLAMVMFFSSWITAAPAFATINVSELPSADLTITEGHYDNSDGTDYIDVIKELSIGGGYHVLIRYTDYEVDWWWKPQSKRSWREAGDVSIDDDDNYIELLSTYGLPANDTPYELIVVREVFEGKCRWDDVLFKVYLTVNENKAPDADDDSETIPEGGFIDGIDYMTGDSDPDGDELHFEGFSDENGNPITELNGFMEDGGVISFQAPDKVDQDTDLVIYYRIGDRNVINPKEDVGKITVTVTFVNDPPVANPDSAIINEDESVTISPLDNDSDEEGNTLALISVTPVSGAVLADLGIDLNAGTVKYTAPSGFNGTVILSYEVSDGNSVVMGEIKIEVNEVNEDKPVEANSDSGTLEQGMYDTFDVLSNDVIPGGLGTLEVGVYPDGFTVVEENDMLKVTAPADALGDYEIFYKVTAADGDSDEASLIITVVSTTNNPINAVDFTASVIEGGMVDITPDSNTIDLFNLDPGEEYTFVNVAGGLNGSVMIINNGKTIKYTHNGSDLSQDSIQYTVSDGVFTDEGTITINILPELDAPIKAEEDIVVMYSDDVDVWIDVLSNDSFDNGLDDLIIENGLIEPAHGEIVVTEDLNGDPTGIKYTPKPNFYGLDFFEYKIVDDIGQMSTAIVFVDVRKIKTDKTDLGDLYLHVYEDEFASLSLQNMIQMDWRNVKDVELYKAPAEGVMTIDQRGFVSYQAPKDTGHFWPERMYAYYVIKMDNMDVYYGKIKVRVHTTDQITLMDDIRVAKERTVEPGNEQFFPIFDNDLFNGPMKDFGLAQYDESFNFMDKPAHGTVRFTEDGVYYKPDLGYVGLDFFRYYVYDNSWWGDVAQVLISVEPANVDDTVIPDMTIYTFDDEIIKKDVLVQSTIDLLPAYFDVSSVSISADFDTVATAGTVDVEGMSKVVYDPNLDDTTAWIRYVLTDQFGHQATGRVEVVVNTNSTQARVLLNDWSTIWVNQYSPIEDLRADVTYKPGIGATVSKKFEIIEYTDDNIGHYNPSIVYMGKPLPITDFYGQFWVTFAMRDSLNNEAEDGPRQVNVNYRPDLSFDPLVESPKVILPDGAVEMLDGHAYMELNYMFGQDLGFMNMLYGYDFEDFDEQPLAVIGDNLPSNMTLLFTLDGENYYPISDFWQHAVVERTISDPLTETQTDPSVYMVEFVLEDSRGHMSLPTPAIEVTIRNNDPWINVPEFDLDGENLDYITVGETYYEWFSSTGQDTILVDDVTYGDVEADWIPSIGQPLAHVGVVVEKYNPSNSSYEELEGEFSSDEAGRYRFNYKVIDFHGAVATGMRYLEINTIPTIWNESSNPGNLLEDVDPEFKVLNLGDSYELWTDIMFEDLDTDPLMLSYKLMKVGESDPVMEGEIPASTDLSTIIFNATEPGTYFASYKVEDEPWGEMDEIINSKEIIVNTPPEIMIDEQFYIVTVDDMIDPMMGVDVMDPEDQEALDLLGTDEMLKDNIVLMVHDEIDDVSINLEETMINDLPAGVYSFRFSYTDMYGAMDEKEKLVVILSEPLLMLDPEMVEMEPTGWFPVFNGVEIDEDELYDLLYEAGIDFDFDMLLRAYINEDGVMRELDDLEWVENDSIEIIYKLFIDFSADLDDIYTTESPIMPEPPMPEYDMVLEFTRDVMVNDDDMGDIIFITDWWRETWTEQYGSYDQSVDVVTSATYYYDYHDAFAVLSKFNPVTGQERLVTAIWMDERYDVDQTDIYFDKNCDFDDIAVTYEGDVYGLWRNDIYKLNQETMIFEYLFNINDEVEDYLEDGYLYGDFQSLTIDNRGYLVVAATRYNNGFEGSDLDLEDYEGMLLFFDPDGYEPTDSTTLLDGHIDDLHYVVEIAAIDFGGEFGYQEVTDLVYNEDFSALYGIGSFNEDPNDYEGPVKRVEPESGATRDGDMYYEIFRLVNTTSEDMRVFSMTDAEPLEFGYMYKGIATIGPEIFVTGYMTDCLCEELYDMEEDIIEVTLLRTKVNKLTYLDGFVDHETFVPVGGLFRAATGAATDYQIELDLMASPTRVRPGQAVTLTLTAIPEYLHGVPVWYKDNVAFGTGYEDQVYIAESVAPGSTRTVTFVVTTALGSKSVSIVIFNDDEPDDPDPTPNPTPRRTTPDVEVTLDTNAVILDYGETADPEFTSYDFTETVTGTTNEDVTWELDDETFVSVDENGLVQITGDVPVGTGDITVTLTVRSVADPTATDTATILFEEQVPLAAIEFFDPYIQGYPDGSFKPKNSVTRAEVASMFARILGLNTTAMGSQKFTDVNETHWAYGSIQAMYRTGIFKGYLDADGNRYFDPESSISRAEIAQVFSNYWTFRDVSVNGGNTMPIPDVPANHWAAPAINRIYNTGIFTGFDDGMFMPFDPTLREQIVMMINTLIARPENFPEASKFNDILPTHEHFGDIEAASQTFLKPQGE